MRWCKCPAKYAGTGAVLSERDIDGGPAKANLVRVQPSLRKTAKSNYGSDASLQNMAFPLTIRMHTWIAGFHRAVEGTVPTTLFLEHGP
jgi:hypothetical protein